MLSRFFFLSATYLGSSHGFWENSSALAAQMKRIAFRIIGPFGSDVLCVHVNIHIRREYVRNFSGAAAPYHTRTRRARLRKKMIFAEKSGCDGDHIADKKGCMGLALNSTPKHLQPVSKIILILMKITLSEKVFSSALEIKNAIASARNKGKTLVTTNGCFDILHAGHVQYLSDAAGQGDILVVGVNCDLVVQQLKGPGRPLQNEADRVMIMASLCMVDYAFIFREPDPRTFLEILRPDIHVKGGDYSSNIIETQVVEKHGGKVKFVSFLKDRSTTSLVEKIRTQ
jgi:rfaE bifunctional protein nucleotidyltransferase chain/domain